MFITRLDQFWGSRSNCSFFSEQVMDGLMDRRTDRVMLLKQFCHFVCISISAHVFLHNSNANYWFVLQSKCNSSLSWNKFAWHIVAGLKLQRWCMKAGRCWLNHWSITSSECSKTLFIASGFWGNTDEVKLFEHKQFYVNFKAYWNL